MKPTPKNRDLFVVNEGRDSETTIDLDAEIIDCGDLNGYANSTGHLELARVLADRVAREDRRFMLRNVTDSLRKEFRRAAERRGVQVYAGAARNLYGEIVQLGIYEFRRKTA
ncbi:hypothetical protein [Leclercia sp.]|uniref:hypothetical protein n=1 Tax=Leclercia sp. TaxID=1898428 RepID=UPI0028ABE852|nr:hypothetical protein [Leclercia sp.]